MTSPATTPVAMRPVPHWLSLILQCPSCRAGRLETGVDALTCDGCGRSYAGGPVPLLLVDSDPIPRNFPLAHPPRTFRRAPWIGDALIDDLLAGALVLSAAEGYGDVVLRAAVRRPDLYFVAFDLMRERVEHAERLRESLGVHNVWFCAADLARLPFASGAFEAGYARGVLHVLPDPRPAIAELRRVLRARLLVDQLTNRPFFALWFWLLQRYEEVRARLQGRGPDKGIWQDVVKTLGRGGAYWPLWKYRRWFKGARATKVHANCVFIWETGRHRALLGWLGYAGAIDVRF